MTPKAWGPAPEHRPVGPEQPAEGVGRGGGGGMAGRVPEAVAGAVEESRAALRGALAEPLSAWRQDISPKRPGPVVFSSPGGAEGGSWRRFRAELLFSLPAQDGTEEGSGGEGCAESRFLRDIFENYCLFHRRETWDPSIATQRELRRWEGGYSCVAYTTAAAAGGAIGPRLMVDVRVHRSEELPFENCSTNSADFDEEAVHGLGEGGRRHVRAANLPGGGCTLARVEGGDAEGRRFFRFCMLGRTDLGGWLPAALANSASAGAYRDILAGGLPIIEAAGGRVEHWR